MSTRADALRWLASRKQMTDGPICSSKLFLPHESWTYKKAWWIRVPLRYLESETAVNFLCRKEASAEFFHLKVPIEFLRSQVKEFHILSGTINLHLSGDEENMFVNERGKNAAAFEQFLVNY